MTQVYDVAVKQYTEEMHTLGHVPKPFYLWLEEHKQKGQFWECSTWNNDSCK